MGGFGHDDDNTGGLPSQDRTTDFGDDGTEKRRQVIGEGLGGCGTGYERDLANKGLSADVEGNNCGVHRRKAYLRAVYRCGNDGGIQQIPQVVGPRKRTHTGGEGSRVKDK